MRQDRGKWFARASVLGSVVLLGKADRLWKVLSKIVVGIVNLKVSGWLEPVREDSHADTVLAVLAREITDSVESSRFVTKATEHMGGSLMALCLGVPPLAGEFLPISP